MTYTGAVVGFWLLGTLVWVALMVLVIRLGIRPIVREMEILTEQVARIGDVLELSGEASEPV